MLVIIFSCIFHVLKILCKVWRGIINKVFLIFCSRACLLLFPQVWLLYFYNRGCRRLTQQSSWALFCFKFETHIQWADRIFKIWENDLAALITSNSICYLSTIFQLLVHRATFQFWFLSFWNWQVSMVWFFVTIFVVVLFLSV